MSTHDTLLNRRTIQRYEDAPIDEEALFRALRAALRAPNHKLTNPWRFTRVGPQIRERLTDLGVQLKLAKKDQPTDKQRQFYREKFGNPAELIVVSQVLDDDDFRRKEDYAAVACAIQNMCLSLWADDIGSKWATGGLTRHPKTYQWLDIDRDKEEIVGFVWVGQPQTVPDPPRDPLDEVMRTTD